MGKFTSAARIAALTGFGAALAGAAEASSDVHSCTRGSDTRVIEVMAPGVVGAACDLKYVRESGANVSVPYHADNAADFCSARARDLIRSLQDSGYDCVAVASLEDQTPIGEGESSGDELTAPDAETAYLTEEAQEFASASEAEPEAEPIAPAQLEAPSPPPMQSLAIEDRSFETKGMESEETLLAQEPGVASRGPVALAPESASFEPTSAPRRVSAVGRITGAEPGKVSEERLDIAPLHDEGEPKSEKISNPATNAAPAAEAPVVEASAPKPVAAKPRLAEDVIKNVLYAQAAAWNDGDLNAFMNGYWKNDNVRFISGGSVSKGWNQALKQYKDRYGEGANLGRLSFENLEVQMVDDEVGLVIGRYVLTRNGETDNGVFSLVMKRFDGVWRIVADHSTAAPTVTQ
ncbi:MAG TPA: DUF4440 domain-containing protein [Parvularculaceae bacterium]|nr:DUF4440 domain-containing protein [Parvularculaceae bacterium]